MSGSKSTSDWGCLLVGFIFFLVLGLIGLFTNWLFDNPKDGSFTSGLAVIIGIGLFIWLLNVTGLISFKSKDDHH